MILKLHFYLMKVGFSGCISSIQFSRSVMSDSATPWIAAHQGLPVHHQLLEFTQTHVHQVSNAIQPSHPLSPLLLLPSIFPRIRVFSSESAVHIRWPKYWSFRFSISPSNEYLGLISFKIDSLISFVVQGTLKSLLQHHNSKASILQCSAFFMVQPSHPHMTTGKTRALTWAAGCIKSAVRLKFLLFQWITWANPLFYSKYC